MSDAQREGALNDQESASLAALARVFAPERAGLEAVLAAISDLSLEDIREWRAVASPTEIVDALALDEGPDGVATAWETLQSRGILPAEYAADGARAFVHPEVYPSRWSDESVEFARDTGRTVVVFQGARWSTGPDQLGRGDSSHVVEHRALSERPWCVSDVVAIASDARGVLTAESLMREYAARLERWGVAPGRDRTLWRVIGAGARMSVDEEWTAPQPPLGLQTVVTGPVSGDRAQFVLDHLGGALWGARDAAFDDRSAVVHLVRQQLWCALSWAARVRQGARVAAHLDVPRDLWGALFAELPDPFEPLRSLWSTGYVLQGIYEEGAILLAPREAEPVAAVRETPRRDTDE